MHLKKLEVQNFRNLKDQIIEFPKKITVLIGNNGQGKTNIIEAVYLLSHAKSFRGSRPVELVNGNLAASTLACNVKGYISEGSLNKIIEYSVSNGKRQVFLNEKSISSPIEFYGQFRVVEFIPSDLELIRGSPSIRRQFVDKTLAMTDSGYVENLVHYQRAIKQRNKVLKSTNSSEDLLPWDMILIETGRKIAEKRKAFLAEILIRSRKFYQYLLTQNISEESIFLEYKSDFVDQGKVLSTQNIQNLYLESRGQDFGRELTSLGVHRDEIDLLLDTGFGNKSARKFSSQGQARNFALSLKLGALDYVRSITGSNPILLLDDVESELDSFHCAALFRFIVTLDCQVIVTSTGLSEALRASGIEVDLKEVAAGML